MKNQNNDSLTSVKVGNLTFYTGKTIYPKVAALSSVILLFVVMFLLPFLYEPKVNALALTWDGGGADNNWSTCANWTTDTCPGSADDVTFNSTSTKDSVVDVGFGGLVNSVTVTTGYTGTLSLSRSLRTIAGFGHSTGIFNANSETLDVDGAFSTTGGTFNASTGLMYFGNTFTIGASATFNNNGGTVVLDTAGGTITCNNAVFNLVQFAHTSNIKTISSGCNLPLGANPTVT